MVIIVQFGSLRAFPKLCQNRPAAKTMNLSLRRAASRLAMFQLALHVSFATPSGNWGLYQHIHQMTISTLAGTAPAE